jgi:hypothetical protein
MVPAIIGAVALVIGGVLAAVVTGRRSGAVERQKFRREVRAPIYDDFTEKAEALSRELWVIRFNVASAATNSPVKDLFAASHSITGGRRVVDRRTAGYRQAYDEFRGAADRVTRNGSRRARDSVGFMRKRAIEADGRLEFGDDGFFELSVYLARYVDLFDNESQRAISIFRNDLGMAD